MKRSKHKAVRAWRVSRLGEKKRNAARVTPKTQGTGVRVPEFARHTDHTTQSEERALRREVRELTKLAAFAAIVDEKEMDDLCLASCSAGFVEIGLFQRAGSAMHNRELAIEWMAGVVDSLEVAQETYFSVIDIFDRYCNVTDVPIWHLQLVLVTALFIACKIMGPVKFLAVADCVALTDDLYSKKQVLAMESRILTSLNFAVANKTFYSVLHILSQPYKKTPPALRPLTEYVLELCLFKGLCLHNNPVLLCAASISAARWLSGLSAPNTQLAARTAVASEKMHEMFERILAMHALAWQDKQNAIRIKYSTDKFHRVAEMMRY